MYTYFPFLKTGFGLNSAFAVVTVGPDYLKRLLKCRWWGFRKVLPMKCLLQALSPRTNCKSRVWWRMLEISVLGWWTQKDPLGADQPASLPHDVSSRQLRDLVSKNNVENDRGRQPISTSSYFTGLQIDLHMCSHTPTCSCT